MIDFLRNMSIKQKLITIIVLISSVLVIAGFIFVIHLEVITFKTAMVNQSKLIAKLVGDYSVTELTFNDNTAADETLKTLNTIPFIKHVYLFDKNKKVFAQFSSISNTAIPKIPFSERKEGFHHEELHVNYTITYKDETYGTIYLVATTKVLDKKIENYILTMIFLIAILLIAALILASIFQRLITAPVKSLTNAVEKIAKSNDYSMQVKKYGNDEIGSLCDGVNNMLEVIYEKECERDEAVNKLKAKQDELVTYMKELKRSNDELDQFAYITSHDLKAPLRAISNLSTWIEEDVGDNIADESKKHFDLLRSRVHRMEGLINGILQYSRVGRIKTTIEECNVGEMLHEVIDMLSPDDNFSINISENMPTLSTEKIRLQQVFSNLISNAIKYHDKKSGTISISVSDADVGEFYEFTVQDDGPGIEPEFFDKIFIIFQTLQARDQYESTGVGLSLVKKIVEDQHGTIRVESEIGKGSSFIFTWPKNNKLFEELSNGKNISREKINDT